MRELLVRSSCSSYSCLMLSVLLLPFPSPPSPLSPSASPSPSSPSLFLLLLLLLLFLLLLLLPPSFHSFARIIIALLWQLSFHFRRVINFLLFLLPSFPFFL